jgi:GTP-binding protein HflX
MLGNMFEGGCLTSALTGAGVEALLQAIDSRLGAGRRLSKVTIGPTDGAARAWLFERGEVRVTEMGDSGSETINVAMDEADWSRFRARWPDLATA